MLQFALSYERPDVIQLYLATAVFRGLNTAFRRFFQAVSDWSVRHHELVFVHVVFLGGVDLV